MQGRQGIERTGRLSSQCPSTVKLALLLFCSVSTCGVAYMWEGAARWSTQLRRGCWVATGLSRWIGCSDPQGSERGTESINTAKMKLILGCQSLSHLASYTNCLQCFLHLDDGWFGTLGIQSIEMLPSNFFVRQKWYVGILVKMCCSCKTKEYPQQR